MDSTPKCSCGNQTSKKCFSTFEYYYCSACKKEVDPKPAKEIEPLWAWDSKKPLPPLPNGAGKPLNWGNLPKGYVALAGEDVTCSFCGVRHGTLNQDLPDASTDQNRIYFGTGTYVNFSPNGNCCPNMKFDRYNAFTAVNEIHIKDRGWL